VISIDSDSAGDNDFNTIVESESKSMIIDPTTFRKRLLNTSFSFLLQSPNTELSKI
jgi:hypothetical protein